MPLDPDRRKAEQREDRAGEPREADEPRGDAPEREREQRDLFPWELEESGAESGAGLEEESGPAGGLADRRGDRGGTAEARETRGAGDAEAPEEDETAGSRRTPGLMSREKVLWEWPYPGDWIEDELD